MNTVDSPDPAEPSSNPQNTTPTGSVVSGDLGGDSNNPRSNKKALFITLSIVALLILLIVVPLIIFALNRDTSAGKRLADKARECGHEPVITVSHGSGGFGSGKRKTTMLVPDNPGYKSAVDDLKEGDDMRESNYFMWLIIVEWVLGGRSSLANAYCTEAEALNDPDLGAVSPDIDNNASQSVDKAVNYFNGRFYYPKALDSTKQISGLLIAKDGTKYSFAITEKGSTSEHINSNNLFTCQKASITPGVIKNEYQMKPDPGYGIIFQKEDMSTKLPSFRALQYYSTKKDSVTPESAQRILDAFPYIQTGEDAVCYFQQYGTKIQITADIIDSISVIPDFSAQNYNIELF